MNSFEPTLPESPNALALQIDSIKKGRGKAILVTPGEEMPEVPNTMKVIDSEVGTWIYNPLKISRVDILKKVEDGSFGEILGHIEPKSERADSLVIARDDEGNEIKSSVVSEKNIKKQFKSLKKQFPEANFEAGGADALLRLLQERINGGTPT